MRTYHIIETVTREITERQALNIVENNRQEQLSPTFPLGCYVRVVKQESVFTGYAGVVTDVSVPDNCAGHRYVVSILVDGQIKDVKLHASDLKPLEPAVDAA